MKSRQRPPLNLSSLDPVEPDQHEADQPIVDPTEDFSLDIDRPMSERRRRRLAEEQTREALARAQALAENERTFTADITSPSLTTPVASAEEASLAPYEAPSLPITSRTRKTATPSEAAPI